MVDAREIGLRQMRQEDLQHKVRWANDPEVNQHVGFDETVTLDGTRKWFATQMAAEEIVLFTITLGDEAIGYLKLERHRDNNEGEYHGLVIGEHQHWGKGYGKQVVRRLLQYGFEEEEWTRLFGYWPAWNERSIKMHEKLGFGIDGLADHQRKHIDGTTHDVYVMSITADAYRALAY